MLWLAVLVGAIIGMNALSGEALRLLDTGTKSTGTVLAFADPAKAPWTIDVKYVADGSPRTAEIVLDRHREFSPGQTITVVYDPADPGHVRTLDDENSNQGLTALCMIPAIAALVGIAFSLRSAVSWFRRHCAVRRTGWQRASVIVEGTDRAALLTVRHADGRELSLKPTGMTRSVPSPVKAGTPQQVWAGGKGRKMTLLFRRHAHPRLHAVPVRTLRFERRT